MGTTAEKIEYLNETKELIKQSLNDLGAEIENSDSFRNYVQKINTLYEDWPKITEEGTSLSLNSTQKGKMKIELKGNTSQDGTPTPSTPVDINVVSGSNVIITSNKNLFNGNMYNGIVASNGIFSSQTNRICNANSTQNNVTYLKAGTYTLLIQNLDYCSVLTKNKNYEIIDNFANNWNSLPFTFTLTSDGYIYFTARKNDNSSINSNDYNAQIIKGSTATTYETHQGKELPLDLPVENLARYDNSLYTSSSLSSFGSFNITLDNSFNVLNGEEYYFSANVRLKSGTGTNLQTLRCGDVGGTGQTMSFINNPNLNSSYQRYITKITFQQDLTLTQIAFQLTSAANNAVIEIKDLMISRTNAAYTPYGTTPIELCKVGDYQDYFYKSGSKWYLHKEIEKVVLDGTENWGTFTTEPNNLGRAKLVKSNILSSDNVVTILCDKLIGLVYQGSWNVESESIISYNNNSILCQLDVNTLEAFKTKLSTGYTVYYVLSTPINTEITDTTLKAQLEAICNAISYNNQTHITQENNNLPFILNVSALQKNSY